MPQQHQVFCLVALYVLEASQIPCKPQRVKRDNDVTGRSLQEWLFLSCIPYLWPDLITAACWQGLLLQKPLLSKLSILFNSNNSPLTGALCSRDFCYIVLLPFKSHVLGKKKAGQGPLAPSCWGSQSAQEEAPGLVPRVFTLTPVLLLNAFPSRNIQ